MRISFKSLQKRLTGVFTPMGGLSWQPPILEQDIAKSLITFLEDRRVLYVPFAWENTHHVVQSVLAIRQKLTEELEKVEKDSTLGQSMRAMRAACQKFLNETQRHDWSRDRYHLDGNGMVSLGELRGVFGIHIARISHAYRINIEGELASILLEEPE